MHKICKHSPLLLLILLFISCSEKPKPTEKNTKPNIVLINVDDLGWKDLAFMGSDYYDTPNVDALAKEGKIFMNAYSAAANCGPSRACLISGLNTPQHGVYTVKSSERGKAKTRKIIPIENTIQLADSYYTLPEMLKSAGYITANVGKWHVSENPKTQGIDVNVGGGIFGHPPGKNGYFSPYDNEFLEDGPEGEYLTDRLTTEAISFVEKNKDSTFFLYLPYYTVHTPIMGKPELVEKYKDKEPSNGQDNPEYAAMVASMDENVGRVMAALKKNNLEENTIVILTSDNGGIRDISEQNPLRAGKGSYYEGGIRVPLVIRWPGKIAPNTTTEQPVSNLDFYPTLQAIAEPSKPAASLDGVNLAPIFNDSQLADRDLYFHFPVYLQAYSEIHDDGRDPLFRTRPGSVIISGDWKLHEYFEDDALELYNLKDDLGERHNLATTNPEKTKELHDKLVAWRTKENAPVPTELNPKYDAAFEKSLLDKVGSN